MVLPLVLTFKGNRTDRTPISARTTAQTHNNISKTAATIGGYMSAASQCVFFFVIILSANHCNNF